MLIAASVLVAVPTLLWLQKPDTVDRGPPAGPFLPPTTPSLTWPTTIEDCQQGRWRTFGQFRDEAACAAYVGYGNP